jgi:hypothetical protein
MLLVLIDCIFCLHFYNQFDHHRHYHNIINNHSTLLFFFFLSAMKVNNLFISYFWVLWELFFISLLYVFNVSYSMNIHMQSNLIKRERIKRDFALSGTQSFAS